MDRPKLARTSLECISIVSVALGVQLVCRYYGVKIASGVSFDWITLCARLVAIGFAALVLRFPLRALGIRLPKISRNDAIFAVLVLAVVALALFAWRDNTGIRGYYRNPLAGRSYFLEKWLLFVLSATLSWELLHRGLLLFGLKHVFERALPASAEFPGVAAALVTLAFETLFHVTKPLPEAIGMMALSPVLSWIALRTGSVAVPMAMHAAVELLFYWFTLANL